MPIRMILAALAAAATLAACGGDPKTSTAERQAAVKKAMLAYAACMREHGVPMQDPKFTADGGVQMTSGGPGRQKVSPQTEQAAQRACEHYQKEIKPPGGNSPARDAEFRKQALDFSRCMRSHGVPNFPDPQFGSNGEVRMKLRAGGANGVDPQDPTFQSAQKACAKYRPGMVTGQ